MAIANRSRMGDVGRMSPEQWRELAIARELSNALAGFEKGHVTFQALVMLALRPTYIVPASRNRGLLIASECVEGDSLAERLIVYGGNREANSNILGMRDVLMRRTSEKGSTTAHVLAAFGFDEDRERLGKMPGIPELRNSHGTSVKRILDADTKEERVRILHLTTY